jgi:hypothetical protein
MGNTDSKPIDVPVSENLDSKSVHDDVAADNTAFSFGTELELVLVPDRVKIERQFPKILSDIPTGPDLQKQFGTMDKNHDELNKLRSKWAACVTTILQFMFQNNKSFQVISSQDESAKELKKAGTYYRRWTVIEDPAIDLDPTVGECMYPTPSHLLPRGDSYLPISRDCRDSFTGAILQEFSLETRV